MKLGFWTLGMPPWSIGEVAAAAVRHGYHGVDLRCTRPADDGTPTDGGNVCIASARDEVASIVSTLKGAGVTLSSLLCYASPEDTGGLDWDDRVADIRRHAQLAQAMGAQRIRLPMGVPAERRCWVDHLQRLWDAIEVAVAEVPGVGVVLENHPGRATAAEVLSVAHERGNPQIGVVLSPDHAIVMQEDVVGLIGEYSAQIQQVCFSDRRLVRDGLADFDGRYYEIRYEECMVGTGDLPTPRVFQELDRCGFDGFVSLKWGKSERFGHHLRPGDEALEPFAQLLTGLGVIDGRGGR